MGRIALIKLGETAETACDVALFNDGALEECVGFEHASALDEKLQSLAEDCAIAAILPGEQVAMRAVPNPPRNAQKFLSAARLLLEDELATPIEDCHIGVHQSDDIGKAFAMRADLASDWRDHFHACERPLTHLCVDYDCLGGAPDRPVVLIEDDRICASFGDRGFAADKTLAMQALQTLQADREEVSCAVYGGPEASPAFNDPRYERLGAGDAETFLTLAAQAIEEGKAANLLQGNLRPRRQRLVDLNRWRRPALAAGLLALLGVAALIADGLRTGAMTKRYEAEIVRIHQENFPEAAAEDPLAHARVVLTTNAGASFARAANALDRALADHQGVTVDRLRFDSVRGELSFAIRSASDEEIESFRQSLLRFGVQAGETSGYRRAGAFWVGEMTARL